MDARYQDQLDDLSTSPSTHVPAPVDAASCQRLAETLRTVAAQLEASPPPERVLGTLLPALIPLTLACRDALPGHIQAVSQALGGADVGADRMSRGMTEVRSGLHRLATLEHQQQRSLTAQTARH